MARDRLEEGAGDGEEEIGSHGRSRGELGAIASFAKGSIEKGVAVQPLQSDHSIVDMTKRDNSTVGQERFERIRPLVEDYLSALYHGRYGKQEQPSLAYGKYRRESLRRSSTAHLPRSRLLFYRRPS